MLLRFEVKLEVFAFGKKNQVLIRNIGRFFSFKKSRLLEIRPNRTRLNRGVQAPKLAQLPVTCYIDKMTKLAQSLAI